jgi:hypothetical protein
MLRTVAGFILMMLLAGQPPAAYASAVEKTAGKSNAEAATQGGSSRRPSRGRAPAKRAAPKPTPTPAAESRRQEVARTPAVAVVNRPDLDYLSGEASVTVNPKQPTVIKMGLAQNATAVVEWTASDLIYYHHEGNDKLVTVFDSPTKETDHFITLYPGPAFVAPSAEARKQGARLPSTTITLQMTSGLVLILELVPVEDVSRNAHRVVVNYNRDEVIAARKAAGLAVNLDGKEAGGTRTNANSVRVAKGGQGGGAEEEPARTIPAVVGDVDSSKADANRKKGRKPVESSEAASRALVGAVKSPEKLFKNWSPVSNGMSLSVSPAADVDDRSRVVVVAVKNASTAGLRLVPGSPEIYIQILDDKMTPLRVEAITRLHVETTALGGRIPAGQAVYYAIVYETQILGSHEKLRVSVSQTDAADAAITADMGQASR